MYVGLQSRHFEAEEARFFISAEWNHWPEMQSIQKFSKKKPINTFLSPLALRASQKAENPKTHLADSREMLAKLFDRSN